MNEGEETEGRHLCKGAKTQRGSLWSAGAQLPPYKAAAKLPQSKGFAHEQRAKDSQTQREVDVKLIVSAVSVMVAVCNLQAAWGAMWYVAPPPAGSNKNPGTVEHPFATIQGGIDKAANGDTVIVAQGTYVENIQFKGKNIVLRSTDPTDWNVVKETVIDGNKSGSVVTFTGTEHETCIFSGFNLRNGSGTSTAIGGDWGDGPGGGGIFGGHMWNHTHATVENNLITGNQASFGAAIFGLGGTVRNNVIVNNSASLFGTLALCFGVIENNLIVGNSAGYGGGGLAHCAAVRNSTVVANSAPLLEGAGLWHIGVTPYGPPGGAITNCIIWGNTAPTPPQVYDSVVPTYCCIQDWPGGGEGNLSGDPGFVDPDGPDDDPNTFEDNDYRLLLTSPCIDAGINEDWMNGAVDLDGNLRILLGATSLTVDMGAYEYRFDLGIARNQSNVELSWTMRPQKSYTVLSSFDMTAQPWAEETTTFGGKTGGPAVWVDPSESSGIKFYKIGIE